MMLFLTLRIWQAYAFEHPQFWQRIDATDTALQITQTDPPCQPEEHFQQLPLFIRLPA